MTIYIRRAKIYCSGVIENVPARPSVKHNLEAILYYFEFGGKNWRWIAWVCEWGKRLNMWSQLRVKINLLEPEFYI